MKVNSQVNLDCGTWGDVNIDREIEIQVNGIIKCHVLKNQGQRPGIQLDEIFVLKLKSVNKNKKVCKKNLRIFVSCRNLCFGMGQSDGECFKMKLKKFKNNIFSCYNFAAKSISSKCRFQQKRKKYQK